MAWMNAAMYVVFRDTIFMQFKKEEEKKVNRRQAKQTTTIKQIKTKKTSFPITIIFLCGQNINISVYSNDFFI